MPYFSEAGPYVKMSLKDYMTIYHAAQTLYLVGKWELPPEVLPLDQQEEVWEEFRDAMGWHPGYSSYHGMYSKRKDNE